MKTSCNILTVGIVIALAGIATADWDPGDPHKMHYPQLPDLSQMGLDVLAGPDPFIPTQVPPEKFLADDFLCTGCGPITDVHIWSSYNQDLRWWPNTALSIGFYKNLPADELVPYSRPGELLWDAYLRPTRERIYAEAPEDFYNPNLNEIVGTDTIVWQFNFDLTAADKPLFRQERGEVYWLGLKHTFDLDGNGVVDFGDVGLLQETFPAAFGWKTSGVEQFMDDAVWTDVTEFTGEPIPPHYLPDGPTGTPTDWRELRDPRTGASLDLAFVIEGLLLGDINGDGELDHLDVDPFLEILLNGPYRPTADMNCDGLVNGLDVKPFRHALLAGSALVVPEPAVVSLAGVGLLGLLAFGWRRRK